MMDRDEFERCAGDVVHFIQTHCVIRHPMRGAIPFALWDWQAELLRTLAREPLVIVLKARQLGVSELAAAYALWRARFTPGWLGLLVSRNQSDACELLDRIGFMYDHLPSWLQAAPPLRRRVTELDDALDVPDPIDGLILRKRNSRVLEFSHQTAAGGVPSRIQSLPATRGTGRGKPASWVFLDEWAHQPWQPQIFAAIKPTLATGGSLLGVSTANGVGNTFHQIWAGAERGDNGFIPIFLPWRRHPEHDESWHSAQSQSMEPWQLAQEHPDNATEAFIQSGQPVFDVTYLKWHEERIRGCLTPGAGDEAIWVEPLAGHRYVIGADVAEGLATGDFDAAVVIDTQAMAQVAALRGKWPPDVFAQKLADLGYRYNTALLAVERNNHGHACLVKLRELGYPHLYHTMDALHANGREEPRPGWLTTRASKPLIVDHLAALLREHAYLPMDLAFLAEALVYRYAPNGATGAPPGFHDDLVMAHAIAAYIATQIDSVAHTAQLFADLKLWHDDRASA